MAQVISRLSKLFCTALLVLLALGCLPVVQPAYAADMEIVPIATEDEIEYYDFQPGQTLTVEGGQDLSPLEAASNAASEFISLIYPFLVIIYVVFMTIVAILMIYLLVKELRK